MAGSVQFMGKEQVLTAFENRGVEAWAIFQGKQFIHKGIGSEDLSEFLDMLKDGGSNATYCIKIFEDVTDLKAIKEKTECDGSYNFKISGPNEGGTIGSNAVNSEVIKRLQAIENKLEDPPADENDEEPETIGSVIIEVIKDPMKAMQWLDIIKGIFSSNHNPAATNTAVLRQIPPAKVGATDPVTEDEKLIRLEKAIDILGANDPAIIQHLEKLADISTKKPVVFKTLLSMLENM